MRTGLCGASIASFASAEQMPCPLRPAENAAPARESDAEVSIVRGDWPPGGDELTPTMKLKRRPIAEKYAREIDAMYTA